MASSEHPAYDILRSLDAQDSSESDHPAYGILKALDANESGPPATVSVPLVGGGSIAAPPAAANDTAPRLPGNFHPMPSATATPWEAAKKAFGDPSTIGEEGSGPVVLDAFGRVASAGVAATTTAVGNLLQQFGMSETKANKLVGDLNLEALRRGTDLNAPSLMPSDVAPNKLAAVTSPTVVFPGTTGVIRGAGDLASRGWNSLTGRGFGPQFDAQLSEVRGPNPLTGPAAGPTNPLLPSAEAPPVAAGAPPGEVPSVTAGPSEGPTAAPGAPVPQSVGAAATTPNQLAATAMSPKEAAAAQATAENYRLAQGARPGPDDTEYVPGVKPTLAETLGHPGVSLQQKQISNSDLTGSFVEQEGRNNEARIEHVESLAGTPTTVHRLEQAREQQAATDLKAAWSKKDAVDVQPVVDQIQAVLDGPGGKVKPVADAMKDALAPLYDKNGRLEADPEILYGARQQIGYLLSKTAQQEKPGLRAATAQLVQVKDALDGVIEQGAPGYKDYLKNYSEASKPIDVHNLLQEWIPDLKDAKGVVTLQKVNTMMKDIVSQRQASGVNPAKSIDDATMEGLWNLRSDLLRKGNLDLGKARGSDTEPNRTIGESMGLTGAHIAASHIPGGNMLLEHRLSTVKGNNLSIMRNRLLDGTLPPYTPP